MRARTRISLTMSLLLCTTAAGQVVLTGRLRQACAPQSEETVPLSAVLVYANLAGAGNQALTFRTWETHPAGWYRLIGGAGTYTLVFSTPAHFLRPIVRTNLFTRAGEVVNLRVRPRADYAIFHERAWDPKPSRGYYQPFVARGKAVTHVGLRFAHDGVDGFGPGGQDLLVSVHREVQGSPDTWPQVGPTGRIVNVDSGGAKNYIWSAGWNSGEVPLRPGGRYAVHVRPAKPDGVIQAFWRPVQAKARRCYRVGGGGKGYADAQLWMSVGTDGDGLLIPYHKRVHREFHQLTKFGPKWTQTYVARGRSLASVILYAATSGVQPRISRQRVAVRLRRGSPSGPVVGVEKFAVGEGCYTGDASWGAFGAAFAPGEVPLTPGRTYAVEFETLESYETLHGFVNAKGQPSDDRPGFNPYRKHPLDAYEKGKAYFGGTDAVDYDLDMQVIEYEHAADDWARAVDEKDLLPGGDMEGRPPAGAPPAWKPFTVEGTPAHRRTAQRPDGRNHFLRLTSGKPDGKAIDGGWVRRVGSLDRRQTYRLFARVRCSWIVDDKRRCLVGIDPTGQVTDGRAATIVWASLPHVHGTWVPYRGDPVRPKDETISIWLRARAEPSPVAPFRADFDDLALRRIRTGVPAGR